MPRLRLSRAVPVCIALALLVYACEQIEDAVLRRSPGEKLWRKLCADCHGLDGSGNTVQYIGKPAADLTDDVWKYGGDPVSIEGVVREGVFGEMPAHPELSREEMRQLIDYLYKLRGENRGPG